MRPCNRIISLWQDAPPAIALAASRQHVPSRLNPYNERIGYRSNLPVERKTAFPANGLADRGVGLRRERIYET